MSTNSNLDAIEREVRRRMVDYLTSAGVPQGRISLEVLYMLPPDFVRAYRKVFEKALREDVGPQQAGDAIEKASNSKADRTRQAFAQGAKHGKRYNNHWVVKDEESLKLKASVDRKLGRLASELEETLKRGDGNPASELGCNACRTDLTAVQSIVRWKLRHCPRCGNHLEEGTASD